MTDIPNTEYITITAKGVFVGGEPATHYRGEEIYCIENIKSLFKWIQKEKPEIAEIQTMSSKTGGKCLKTGNPSVEAGASAWCRIIFDDGTPTGWVCNFTYYGSVICARNCAVACMHDIWFHSRFRSALFSSVDKVKKAQNLELKKLKDIDFSKLINQPIELNGYRILVEKIAETKQIKR